MFLLQSQSRVDKADDEVDFIEIGRALARQWRKIVIVTVIATAVALRLVLLSHPQFLVTGTLYLGDTGSGADAAGTPSASSLNFLSDYQSVNGVETQVGLIQSKALLERAILETGLNASIVPKGKRDLLFWKWHFLYGASISAFAPRPGDLEVRDATIADSGSSGAGFRVVFDRGGHYRLLTGGGWFSSPRTVLSGALNQPASGAGIALVIKPAADGVVPSPGSQYVLQIAPAKAVADSLLAGPLVINAGGTGSTPTNLANVQMTWGNPYQAQAFVNRLMVDFIAAQLSWKTELASATEEFVSGQLDKIRASLAAANRNLASYQSKSGVIDVPANAQAVISQLAQYEAQRTTIQLQKEALQQLHESLAHLTGNLDPYLVSQNIDPTLTQVAGALANAEVQLQANRVNFTNDASEIRGQEASIAKMKEEISTIITNDESMETRSLANIDALIARYEAQLKAMPAEALQVVALTRRATSSGHSTFC